MASYTVSMARYPTDPKSLEETCRVEFVRDSGPGGQHRNKRYTGIRLTHEPTGTVVMATERRSQSMNRALAFERMAERLTALQHRPKRRKATKPTRASVRRRLDSKAKAAQKKAGRRKPPID